MTTNQQATRSAGRMGRRIGWILAAGLVTVPAVGWSQNRVIVIEEEELTVELEKPEAFYILSPSNLDYQAVDPEASFLDELYATVEQAPF